MPKFKSLEELQEEKERLDKEYESGLPDYLIEYFDKAELKLLDKEYFKNISIAKAEKSFEDRKKYKEEQDERFWEENDAEIVKVPRTVPSEFKYNFSEPPRAEERVDQERDLSLEELKVLAKLCENDLYLFAIRYFPHYLKKPSSQLHKFLYSTLARDVNKYSRGVKWAIAAPRSNSKSSIVSGIFPIWCLCFKKKKFILMISDTLSQAEDFLYDIKQELEFNEKLLRDFPEVCGKGPLWRTNEIITRNGIKILTLGTGSKVRGRKYGVHRPDLMIGDDIENNEMVRSEALRNSVREWFNKEVLFAGGERGSSTDFFVVGTSIGKYALLNALLDPNQYPEWQSRRFSSVKKESDAYDLWSKWEEMYKDRFNVNRKEDAEKFFEDNKEEMLRGTEVLWPEGDPYYDLMVYKITNPSGFLCEKQNLPVDLTKLLVKEEELHFEYFNQNKRVIESIDRGVKRKLIFGALDPSVGKKSTKGDFSVILTLIRDPDTGYLYVIDIDMKRRSVDDQIDAILKAHQLFGYRIFGVETNAFQYVIAEMLRKKSRELGIYVPVEEINNYQDKKMRIEGIVPFLKDGTIVFDKHKKNTNKTYAAAIEQITTYTGEGDEHDDVLDVLEMCFKLAKSPKFKLLTRQAKRERRQV